MDRRRQGYGIIEMVVAVGLAGLLIAIAVPNLRELGAAWALSGATKRVEAAFHLARQRAIGRNTRHRITFVGRHAFQVEREVEPGRFVAEGGLQELPGAVRFGTTRPRKPTFDTRGMLGRMARVTILVPGGSRRTIRADVLGWTTVR